MKYIKHPRDYFLNSTEFLEYKTSVKNIQIFFSNDKRGLFWFNGRERFCKNYRYVKDEFSLFFAIDRLIHDAFILNEVKDIRKEEGNIKKAEIKHGDIFHTSWGYSNTYVDFYQVISRKSETKLIVREIQKYKSKSGGMFYNYVRPIPDQFIGPEKIVSLNKNGDIRNIDDYNHVGYKAEDKDYYTSWGN